VHVARHHYLDELLRVRDLDLVKVLVGMRGCGKTTLLRDVIASLKADGVSSDNIIYLDFEAPGQDWLRAPQALVRHIAKTMPPEGRAYVFLDEIQHMPDVRLAVQYLRSSPRCDVFVASSSMELFRGGSSVRADPGSEIIEVMPLSFAAYAEAAGTPSTQAEKNDALLRYLRYGGYPGLAVLSDEEVMLAELRKAYEKVLLLDVVGDDPLIGGMVSVLMEEVDRPMSLNRTRHLLQGRGLAAPAERVSSMAADLCGAFAFHYIRRYDMVRRQYLPTHERFYVGAPGMRTAWLGFRPDDIDRLIDNAVCLELLRRNRWVSRGRRYDSEVSFVTKDPEGTPVCCQVSVGVPDRKVLSPLLAMDSKTTRRTVITFDAPHDIDLGRGIEQVDVVDWLLQERA
jgi:predicted AAA+ superfamily ATPase